MLGLCEQVRCDQFGVGRGVGKHGHLRRTREQVDPDPAEQLALGFSDVRVPGSDDHVDRLSPRSRRPWLRAPELRRERRSLSAPEVAIECSTGG